MTVGWSSFDHEGTNGGVVGIDGRDHGHGGVVERGQLVDERALVAPVTTMIRSGPDKSMSLVTTGLRSDVSLPANARSNVQRAAMRLDSSDTRG